MAKWGTQRNPLPKKAIIKLEKKLVETIGALVYKKMRGIYLRKITELQWEQ